MIDGSAEAATQGLVLSLLEFLDEVTDENDGRRRERVFQDRSTFASNIVVEMLRKQSEEIHLTRQTSPGEHTASLHCVDRVSVLSVDSCSRCLRLKLHRLHADRIALRFSTTISISHHAVICPKKMISCRPMPGSDDEYSVSIRAFTAAMHSSLDCRRMLNRACLRFTDGKRRTTAQRIWFVVEDMPVSRLPFVD